MERYKVLKTIGDGTFGTVSKAILKSTGEIVAIKRIKRKFATWEECLELTEIRCLRKLVHPCLIKLKEVVRHEGDLNLVFEYVEKNVVQAMQAQGRPFTDAEAKKVVFDLLHGLAYMHRNGFFHRDVKPDNILMGGNLCKLIDFGLVKDMRARPPYTAYVSTRWYRAPEVLLRMQGYSSAVDIFAAGCVFAELYLMRPLFPGTSDLDQLSKLCAVLGTPSEVEWQSGYRLAEQRSYAFPQCPAQSLHSLLPAASPEAISLMSEMLRWNPSHRPPAEDLLKRPFFAGCSLDGPPPSIFPEGMHMEKPSEMLSVRSKRSPSPAVKRSILRAKTNQFTGLPPIVKSIAGGRRRATPAHSITYS